MFEYGTSKPMTISFFRVLQDSAPMRTSQVWIFVMTRILWRPVPMLDTSTCGNTVALAGNKFCLNSELEFVSASSFLNLGHKKRTGKFCPEFI